VSKHGGNIEIPQNVEKKKGVFKSTIATSRAEKGLASALEM